MSELDENAIINAIGGKVIETSSLKDETTQTPENTDVSSEKTIETPTENVDNKEVQSEVKTETTPETKTEAAPDNTQETSVEEEYGLKGFDIYKNLDNEFKESYGLSMNEAEQILSQDYDSEDFDERDLVEDYFISKGLTEREITLNMKKFSTLFKPQEEINQMLEDGNITEDQFDLLEAEWLRLMREGKEYLVNVQDKIREFKDEFEVVHAQDTNDEAHKILLDNANRFTPNYSKETLEILENGKVIDSVEFNTDEATKNLTSDVLKDPSNVYSLWMENGKLNVEKMYRSIYKMVNEKAMNKAIYDQAFAKGQANAVKDQNNIDFNPHRQSTAAIKNIPEGLANAFAQLNGER